MGQLEWFEYSHLQRYLSIDSLSYRLSHTTYSSSLNKVPWSKSSTTNTSQNHTTLPEYSLLFITNPWSFRSSQSPFKSYSDSPSKAPHFRLKFTSILTINSWLNPQASCSITSIPNFHQTKTLSQYFISHLKSHNHCWHVKSYSILCLERWRSVCHWSLLLSSRCFRSIGHVLTWWMAGLILRRFVGLSCYRSLLVLLCLIRIQSETLGSFWESSLHLDTSIGLTQ